MEQAMAGAAGSGASTAASSVTSSVTSGVGTWWDAITAGFSRSTPLDPGFTTLLLVVGVPLVITVVPQIWRYFGLFVTVVHELGHAFAALMTGRIVKGISLRFDHSGQMDSYGKVGFSAAWSGFWGYPAPGLVGLLLIAAGVTGWAPLALSLGALVLLATLLFIRNLAGVVIALASAATAQLLVLFLPGEWTAVVVTGLGAALAIGSLKDLVKVIRVHTDRRDVRQSDAYILSRGSGLPAAVWLVLFALVIGACAVGSGWLLASLLP